MKLRVGLTFVSVAFAVAACASDTSGASSGLGSRNNPVGSGHGACDRGQLNVGTGELAFCGYDDFDDSCPSSKQLAGYTSSSGDLDIYVNTNEELADASCLQTVNGMLSISGGTELTTLDGMGGLKFSKGLQVLGLDKLVDLSGLDNLTRVNELTINGNGSLTDVSGLPSGLTVGSLYMAGNQELISLDGLTNITITDVIAIENNPKISSCKVAAFAKKFPGVMLSNFGNLTEVCN